MLSKHNFKLNFGGYIQCLFCCVTENITLFEQLIPLFHLKPSQIIKPGDLHPRTGKPFKNQKTGGPLTEASWVLHQKHVQTEFSADAVNKYLQHLIQTVSIEKQNFLDLIQEQGNISFEVAWGIDAHCDCSVALEFSSSSWQRMAQFRGDFGWNIYPTYDTFSETEMDEEEEEKSIQELCSIEIYIRLSQFSSEKICKKLAKAGFVMKSTENESNEFYFFSADFLNMTDEVDINTHLETLERVLGDQMELLLPILSVNQNYMLIRRNTAYVSSGVLFSVNLVRYLAQLKMNVIMIDTSLDRAYNQQSIK